MKFDKAQKRMIQTLLSDDFTKRGDAEDTLPDIPTLVQIIKKGFITENSQPGIDHRGLAYDTGEPYYIQERAYVIGYMKREAAVRFMNKFNLTSDKVCYIMVKDGFEKNVRPSEWIPLTISDGKPVTRISLSMTKKTFDFYRKEAHINESEDVVQVVCYDPVWNRKASSKHGLLHDILQALDSKHSKRGTRKVKRS